MGENVAVHSSCIWMRHILAKERSCKVVWVVIEVAVVDIVGGGGD